MQKVLTACKYAAECHAEQRRKDKKSTPYINHPIEVAEFLTFHGVTDPDMIIAALLHDVIEDTNGTSDQIKDMFGNNVLTMVLECSDDKSLDKVQRKRLQIEHAKNISDDAKLVKLSDKYSNIKGLLDNPPTTWTKEVIMGYMYWGMAVCRNLYFGHPTIDQALKDLFTKQGIDINMADDELQIHLENYYKQI